MCDLSENSSEGLIAWLDHELPDDEAARVERHVRACKECRSRIDAYQRVSAAFNTYCDAVVALKVRLQAPRRLPRWVPVLAGVAAAVAALFLAFPRARVEQLAGRPRAAAVSRTVVLESAPTAAAPAPVRPIRRRHAAPSPQVQEAVWLPAAPTIQIAIPGEAMFPPGAVPEGVNFSADLSIAADGSAQGLRMHPLVSGSEVRLEVQPQRRPTQP